MMMVVAVIVMVVMMVVEVMVVGMMVVVMHSYNAGSHGFLILFHISVSVYSPPSIPR